MLIAQGNAVIPVCDDVTDDVLYDGVLALGASKLHEMYKWADVVITTPGRFRNNPLKKDIIFVQHNHTREPWDLSASRVLYCGQYVANKVAYPCRSSFVYWPPNRYYGTKPLKACKDGYITLVNCNANKGGQLLERYAKMLPQYQFLGVHAGYGYQHTGTAPNLTYRRGGVDLRDVLKDTSVLIMPSEKEGLPTLAQEAMALGIPVVGSAIPPFVELGLRENKPYPKNYMIDDILFAKTHYLEERKRMLQLVEANEAKRDTAGFLNWVIS